MVLTNACAVVKLVLKNLSNPNVHVNPLPNLHLRLNGNHWYRQVQEKQKLSAEKNTYIPLHVAKVLASLDSNGLNVTKPCQSYEVSPIKPPKSLGVKHWRASLQVIVAKAPAASQHPSPGSHDDVSQDFVSLPCGCVKSTWKSLLDFCCILFASGTLGKMLAEQVVAACQERPSI